MELKSKSLLGIADEVYFYTYAEEKIILSRILAQVFRCIILATIFIIVCILSRFTLLSQTSTYDSHYVQYDYLQWIPMLIVFYFVFIYFDVIFLQKRYRITIKTKKVSSEHVSRIDGELYYINPGEEISQEKDIKEMTPEEKASKSKKEIIFCIIIFGIVLMWEILEAKNLVEAIYILLAMFIYPIIIPLLQLLNKRKKTNNQEESIEEAREENIITQKENIEENNITQEENIRENIITQKENIEKAIEENVITQEENIEEVIKENIITQKENIKKQCYKSRRYIMILCLMLLFIIVCIIAFVFFNSFNNVTF